MFHLEFWYDYEQKSLLLILKAQEIPVPPDHAFKLVLPLLNTWIFLQQKYPLPRTKASTFHSASLPRFLLVPMADTTDWVTPDKSKKKRRRDKILPRMLHPSSFPSQMIHHACFAGMGPRRWLMAAKKNVFVPVNHSRCHALHPNNTKTDSERCQWGRDMDVRGCP